MSADLYDCIVIGGGIAGLQGAIQLGRYKHRTLVIDKGRGRSTLCRSYHNVLGWPDGVSGPELRRLGRLQAERLGVQFAEAEVTGAARTQDGFTLQLDSGQRALQAATLLLATGIMDRFPPLAGLECCLGETVYVCPDCDGYEVSGRETVVLGSGDVGAAMAITLSYWTNKLTYINHEADSAPLTGNMHDELKEAGIAYLPEAIAEIVSDAPSGKLQGVKLADGRMLTAERGFIAFGGNQVNSSLADQLGMERLENKHIVTDPRSKQTNVPGIWAAGDVGVHSEQVTIAMGEGSQAAIWIHKELLRQKRKEAPSSTNRSDIPDPGLVTVK
ncbi:NAD(P)/FAD-dependent oxidoreductase [Paenibacillus sp. TAB 01]|uniref:NAD(P)/FAD-dependent oxidoreductase n=1 Tax=Paenibacillus sp. TAB 01 TaxID=3368988 RepID=UPI003750C38D